MSDVLRRAIAAAPGKALPVSDYMRVALYDPDHGYYASCGADAGRYSAFYRDPLVSAIYAQSMAAQFEQLWRLLGSPTPFTIVEQGANNAQFAIELLTWLAQWRPEIYAGLRYIIVEPLAKLRAVQEARAREAGLHDHFSWVESLAALAGSGNVGIFYNCEFADSLPTRLVTYLDDWQELVVTWPEGDEGPDFVKRPVENPRLQEEIQRWDIPRVRRYHAEVCLELPRWTSELAAIFDRGFYLTVAYGLDAGTLYHTNRLTGSIHTLQEGITLKGYDVLAGVGQRDITYMVNFSALMLHAETAGLENLGIARQADAMSALARPAYEAFMKENGAREREPEIRDLVKAFRTLLQPPINASSYRFLFQAKGLNAGPQPLERYPVAALMKRRTSLR